ncbi:MAG: 50S ribosomal protein L3 [Planctomycetota bacterium]
MTIGILGRKLGMTQIFREDGEVVPVTVIQAGPCRVLQVKVKEIQELPEEHRRATANKGKKKGKTERLRRPDGYYAVQLGFGARRARNAKQPEAGHAAKAGVEGGTDFYFVREVRSETLPEVQQGQDVTVEAFDGLGRVDVTGITKGRGWAGTIKRWNFHRQPMSHGTKKCHRHLGGTGRTYSTAKGIPKGKKYSGHYGVEKVTIQNLELVSVDKERNLLLIRGAVPGHVNGYLVVRQARKTKKQG